MHHGTCQQFGGMSVNVLTTGENSGARRKEVERLLAVARREAHLFQKVVVDVFNYDQSTFLGSRAALVYRMWWS